MSRFIFLIKRLVKIDGSSFLFVSIIYILFSFLHAMCGLFLPMYIAEFVFANNALRIVIATSLMLIVSEFISNISDVKSKYAPFRYRLKEVGELNCACINIPVHLIDKPQTKQAMENAQSAVSFGNTQGVEAYLIAIRNLLSNFTIIVGYVFILRNIPILILLAGFVLSLAHNFLCTQMDKKSRLEQQEWLAAYNNQEILERAIIAPDKEKDIRLNGIADFLMRKLKTYQEKCFKYAINREKRFMVQSILLTIFSCVRNGLLIFAYIQTTETVSIAYLILYLAVILNIDSKITDVWSNLKILREQRIHIDSLKSFYKNFLFKPNYTEEKSETISKIVFDNVSFEYETHPVIKNFSCEIKSGEKIAIVGKNGAGKTTLIKLLAALYKPSQGQIFFYNSNGESIGDDKKCESISAMFQDNKLLSFSVFENIALTEKPENKNLIQSTEQKIRMLLESVNLQNSVTDLHQNVGTELDDNGRSFSGGESQRLLLARALFKDSSLILMDEPDSALDVTAQIALYNLLADLLKNKTGIFVSHRLGSISFCDRIIFFKDNQELVIGTHHELYSNEQQYKAMYDTETAYLKTIDSTANQGA